MEQIINKFVSDEIKLLFIPGLTAFIISYLGTIYVIKLAKKWGLVDDPKKHKHPKVIHTYPVPRGGGLAIFLAVLFAASIYLPFDKHLRGIILGAFILTILGLLDDKYNAQGRDISPYLRFFIIILAAGIIVAGGISIRFITNPFGEGVLAFPPLIDGLLSIIWLVWIMNMLNWSKGVDGQMPGIVAISALVIGILSITLNLQGTIAIDAILSFIIAGSALGFLLFNFYPAKIFPGWSATSLYLLLGVVAMLSSTKLATAILVMGVPTVDALFTIARRLLAKRSPFKGDNKHLHHLFLQMGFGQRRIALFYWAFSAILGVLAL